MPTSIELKFEFYWIESIGVLLTVHPIYIFSVNLVLFGAYDLKFDEKYYNKK